MVDENSPRGNPEAPVAAAVPPVSAPTAEDRSLQQSQDLNKRLADAKTPAAIRAIKAEQMEAMKQTLKTRPKDFDGKPTVVTPVVPTVTEKPAEAAEETPADTSAETEEAASTTETEPSEGTVDEDDDTGGEGPVEPIKKDRTHLRLAKDDQVGRLAASYMKRNKDMPMEEALDRARKQMGIKPQAEAAATEQPVGDPQLPQTMEEASKAILGLRAERKKATVDLNFELASELSDKIDDLQQHRFALERAEERKQQQQVSAYEQQFSASEQRATDLYSFAGDPKSEGGKRMLEIESALKENDDPLYNSPDKPLRIAQMVARELNIAPRKKGAPVVTPALKTAAAPVVPAPAKKQQLPSGTSRTVAPTVTPQSEVDAQIRNTPNTLQGRRELWKKLGLVK